MVVVKVPKWQVPQDVQDRDRMGYQQLQLDNSTQWGCQGKLGAKSLPIKQDPQENHGDCSGS